MKQPTRKERLQTLELVEANWRTLYDPLKALCTYCYKEGQQRPNQDDMDAYSIGELQYILCKLLETGACSVSQLPGDHHRRFDS